ncbi:mitochondrial coenzyme A transporter SLC25A42 [Eupeodes corollae]|uniref:mitochondrial coenzyme A transporter SLC25A42 n=1 Tax=Eupeodes corollae TaxID=290404 RepID=UPI002491E34D|nr:mitochondrial coenzyme A transporter SLC25A42 [Eupeodes corollae]XP_055903853.1 mitochondrial coenzyme A transporter SLC25A42 [Eupeodes corollae]
MSHLIEKTNLTMSFKTTSTQQSSSDDQTSVNLQTETRAHDKLQPAKINKFDAVLTSLMAGAVAGALAKTTIAPLDRAKINFQISKDTPYSFRAAVQFLKKTYTTEGTFALWRGNSATMARIVPYAAIQFTAHEQWRKILRVDEDGTNTKLKRFMAGSLAGITSQSLTYPLDLARARMAVTDKYSGYNTLRQVFVKIWVEEGPRTLFRGYWATILGVIPYAGTSFFTYETLKKEYNEVYGNKAPNTIVTLAFGAAAGAAGQTASYPLDIVRRRMQTIGIHQKNKGEYTTIYSTLKKIYREEGVKNGFFKGLSMNWIKGPIAVGISFSTYDLTKEFLRELAHIKRGRSTLKEL